jgi:beta-glucanase (GH16 family)
MATVIMRYGLLIAIIILGFGIFATGHPSIQVIHVGATTFNHLVFDDEFNASSLNTKYWNTCYENYSQHFNGCTNTGNKESEWYEATQVSVKNGSLVLAAQKKSVTGFDKQGTRETYPYVSGMVTTGRYIPKAPPKWSGSYGYYEARIKVPSGQSVWPAFWLLPVNHDWPPEIDIMELVGSEPNRLLTTYFWKDHAGNAQKDSKLTVLNQDLSKNWHVYAVDWQPGSISWYLDGKQVDTVKSSTVPTAPMQIIFDLAIGGNLPGDPTTDTPESAQMLVDYVRVYTK